MHSNSAHALACGKDWSTAGGVPERGEALLQSAEEWSALRGSAESLVLEGVFPKPAEESPLPKAAQMGEFFYFGLK